MQNRMSFVYQHDGHVTIKSLPTSAALPEVLESVEQFLRGAGYVFDGQLDIYTKEAEGVGRD